jgi:hypothetical protein
VDIAGLPGADLIERGLRDLAEERESASRALDGAWRRRLA